METDEERRARKSCEADEVAEATDWFLNLWINQGFSPEAVIAGAHSVCAARMAALVGGRLASKSLEDAADAVRSMPADRESDLAGMPPAGRA